MGSCKGLKGKALKKCMFDYVQTSKKLFPRFNQKNDTVITSSGSGSRSAVKNINAIKAANYNPPGLNSQKTVSYTDGTTVSSTITKKRKSK
jgi:hypothetical protein|tara:strand:+ start:17 stop:289 length:273 start_codon:yes stop_codon:yes gene_type:complete